MKAITLRQPTQHKELLKDMFWCFYAPDAQSGTTSSRFTPARSASGTEKDESRF